MSTKTFYLEREIFPATFDQLPIDWTAVFSRPAPLAVEIGFGNGEFLADWQKRQPDWNFVGIEISGESMIRLQKLLHKEALEHVLAVHHDARFALRECWPEESVKHVMMNFPDPWPKDRHKNRRLIDDDFADILAGVLAPAGQYELVTDQDWYAADALDVFKRSQWFEATDIELNPVRPVTTKYERKWREMGRESYRVLATKTRFRPLERWIEDNNMPHSFVNKDIVPSDITALYGYEYHENDRRFIVKSGYQQLQRDMYLLRMVTKDVEYKQDFFVQVKRQDDGRWIVRLDPTIRPYRTPAVKMMIVKVGELLSGSAAQSS